MTPAGICVNSKPYYVEDFKCLKIPPKFPAKIPLKLPKLPKIPDPVPKLKGAIPENIAAKPPKLTNLNQLRKPNWLRR